MNLGSTNVLVLVGVGVGAVGNPPASKMGGKHIYIYMDEAF